jgi:hypothetical protein
VAALVTVIEEVVAPLLHNNDPVAVVDKTEFPQLFVTVTAGAEGVDFGAAIPLPNALAQPFTVVLTVYVPAVLTVIVEVVALLLHNNDPVAVVDSTDVLLQLSTTVTTGVAGTAFGAEIPLPDALVQPLTVVVTV